jgi:hypothetical protein
LIFMDPVQDTESVRRLSPGRKSGHSRAFRVRLTILVLAWALVGIPCSWAQRPKPSDYQVKAAYLYNFGRFVEWPRVATAKSGPFTVCVLGADPFGSTLDATMAGETIAGRNVVAKRISTPEESVNCEILFLSAAEAGRLNKIMEDLDKAAVLTVSDMPQFAQRGGMIQFVLEGNRVRFEVNLTATQHAGLTLSSDLLKVATAVRKNPGGGD